jgi:hypothetical protein
MLRARNRPRTVSAFDFDAAVQAPFRMQPGLRRLAAGAPQLTPLRPGSRHQREKLAVLSAFWSQALLAAPGMGFAEMRAAPPEGWRGTLALALILAGAGSKAGLIPFHLWLPLAHPAAATPVSALMSGAMVKVALYVLVRALFDLAGGAQPGWWGVPLVVLGAGTALLGAIRANTDAVREVTAELRGVVRLLSEQGSIGPKRARRTPLGDGNGEGLDLSPRATWITPIAEAWDKEMGAGSFPYGQALKPLAQLRKAGNTEAEIALRIGYYCRHMQRANEVQFMSIPNFAKTFKTWNPREPAFAEDE